MDASTDRASAPRSSRRRRESKRQVPLLRRPGAGRIILGGMIAMAVATVGLAAFSLRNASRFYGWVTPGMSRDDVRYLLGAPQEAADAATAATWRYRSGTSTTRVDFDGDGRAVSTTCTDERIDVYGCPETLGVRVGMDEESLWSRLGAPDRQGYRGEEKTIGYDALGLQFTLRKFVVTAITLSRPSGPLAFVERLPRLLIPLC